MYRLHLGKYCFRKCEVSLNGKLQNTIFARPLVVMWGMMSGESGCSQESGSDEVYAKLKKSPGWKEDGKKNM